MFDLYLRLEAEDAECATSDAEENERVKEIEPPHLERRAIRVSWALDAAFNADGCVHAIAMKPKKVCRQRSFYYDRFRRCHSD